MYISMYVYIYIYVYVCSKITKLFWSNPPSLLELNIALEQQSITFGAKTCLEQPSMPFGAKACLGATLHHFGSKSLFWSNPPSLLVQKLVWEHHSIAVRSVRSVRSGPVRPVRGPRHWSGPDRPDRTGPDGTPDHLIFVFV